MEQEGGVKRCRLQGEPRIQDQRTEAVVSCSKGEAHLAVRF
jgi:hypothetical protein